MSVPSVEQLKRPTLEYLSAGITDTDEIRARIAGNLQLPEAEPAPHVRTGLTKYINNHAWALVRLQQNGFIQKLAPKTYLITRQGRAWLRQARPVRAHPIDPPVLGAMPAWARRLIYSANQRNRPDGPRFTERDLVVLWERCTGKCAITHLDFTDEKVGFGQAKRAYGPSLDRIDPEGLYTADNCRLVMVAVNFALNAWGEEVYLRLARAAVRVADEDR
jgi:hypothetical protein